SCASRAAEASAILENTTTVTPSAEAASVSAGFPKNSSAETSATTAPAPTALRIEDAISASRNDESPPRKGGTCFTERLTASLKLNSGRGGASHFQTDRSEAKAVP